MRRILFIAALLLAGACKDEDSNRPSPKPDAGATADAGSTSSALDKPGTLARPPKSGLPAELRPPR
jgi:hypothetical protein